MTSWLYLTIVPNNFTYSEKKRVKIWKYYKKLENLSQCFTFNDWTSRLTTKHRLCSQQYVTIMPQVPAQKRGLYKTSVDACINILEYRLKREVLKNTYKNVFNALDQQLQFKGQHHCETGGRDRRKEIYFSILLHHWKLLMELSSEIISPLDITPIALFNLLLSNKTDECTNSDISADRSIISVLYKTHLKYFYWGEEVWESAALIAISLRNE